jgi:predicted Zn-dependent protease with MMP-like domain
MSPKDRDAFDALFERVLTALPARWQHVIDTVSVVVVDRPSPETLESLGMLPSEALDLCGLHTGTPATERSIEDIASMPSEIEIYREGIIEEAGGWQGAASSQTQRDAVQRQIRITLLHELGHEVGLDEDDLEALGYD